VNLIDPWGLSSQSGSGQDFNNSWNNFWGEFRKRYYGYNDPHYQLTPGDISGLTGGIVEGLGHRVGGKTIGIIGLILEPGGTGRIAGIIIGGATGAVGGATIGSTFPGAGTIVGGIAGGVGGGIIGGWIGSQFDYPGAGYLNYNEWEEYNAPL